MSEPFNVLIRTGCFPVLRKIFNIIAIPKSGDSSDPRNYRPISLLSILSKVLERHIILLISDYLNEQKMISDYQWGFIRDRSTTTALLSLTQEWYMHMENGYEVCAIFMDLQKAFNSIPHQDLLHVVKNTGLHLILIKWACSYLSNRS